jgi:CubicO group peptidase (beta-lactamase class C family)
MKKSCLIWILFFGLISLVYNISCEKKSTNPEENNTSTTDTQPEETNDGWQTALLNEVGINENPLLTLIDSIQQNYYDEIHSVVIIKNGYLVFEEYFWDHDFSSTGENFHGSFIVYDRNIKHNTLSATKSIASALVGIAIDNGFIQNEDERIFTYLTLYSHLNDSLKNTITIKHLLTMTSGLEWNECDVHPTDPIYDVPLFNRSLDPMAYLVAKPIVTTPGSSFYYNGGAVDLLGQLVRISSGIDVDVFSGEYLFDPLGITDYQWQRLYLSGIIATHGDVYICPRDMAKFGFLYLNNGVWNGNQIVSADLVDRSIQEYVALPFVYWADAYGYLWWKVNYYYNNQVIESIKAMGWGGQEIIIFPQLNMVIVFTGANYVVDPPCDEIISRFIFPVVI